MEEGVESVGNFDERIGSDEGGQLDARVEEENSRIRDIRNFDDLVLREMGGIRRK